MEREGFKGGREVKILLVGDKIQHYGTFEVEKVKLINVNQPT